MVGDIAGIANLESACLVDEDERTFEHHITIWLGKREETVIVGMGRIGKMSMVRRQKYKMHNYSHSESILTALGNTGTRATKG